MSDEGLTKTLLACLFIGFVGGVFTTCSYKDWAYQGESVKTGHAEFIIIDSTTGKTEFRWKEKP